MQPRDPRWFIPLTLALAVCLGGRAVAGDIEVHPLRVDLSPGKKTAIVGIRNPSNEPGRYGVKIAAWEQAPSGEMKLTGTDEVVAVPQLLELAAGEKRDVRVSTAATFGDVEKSYRLVIEELPPPAKPNEPTQVRVLSRVGIPVFLAPAKREEKASLEALTVQGGRVRFSLWSRGTVHIRPSAVTLTLVGEDGAAVLEKSADTWYVLAGTERRYDLAVPEEVCAKVRSLRVEVTLPSGPLRGEVAAPRGVCGR